MKYFRQLLIPLTLGLLITSSVYASIQVSMLPNHIPKSISFNPSQPGGNIATLSFPNSALPAKFLCYFAASNNQQFKGISATITSENDQIDFLPGTNSRMEAGKSDIKMFTVTPALNKSKMGAITIALEGDSSSFLVTMICTMHK